MPAGRQHRPSTIIVYTVPGRCTLCGASPRLEDPYTICPECWASACYIIKDRLIVKTVAERQAHARELTARLTSRQHDH